jgi:protein SCO1/2
MRGTAILLTLCLLSAGCLGGDSTSDVVDRFNGEDLPFGDPEYNVQPFSLTGTDGNSSNLSDFEGQVLIVSFIYSRCPDVCPVVSANLHWVSQQLASDYGTNFSILSITVDPWWDTMEVLGNYSGERNLSWLHLTGEVEALEPIWENFHVGLQTYENTSSEGETSGRHHPDYLVDHSTATFILDREHRQQVRWNDLDWEPTLFLEDVQQLLDE